MLVLLWIFATEEFIRDHCRFLCPMLLVHNLSLGDIFDLFSLDVAVLVAAVSFLLACSLRQ